MKSVLKRLLPLLALLCLGLAVYHQVHHPRPAPKIGKTKPPPPVPTLLEPRAATTDKPLQSWERLLARDGSPAEDREVLSEMITNLLQTVPLDHRPPLGTNDEITRALTNRESLGDATLPDTHPAIIAGQLVDRWGSSWFFHQQSSGVIEVRSAGPDRRLFSEDDVKSETR
jgi:hypothetical protein